MGMIPIFWRYALISYGKIFSLSVASIVSILIVSRFKEIAHFAVLCANLPKTALFALCQIPFILPMAIPLSSLIASFFLIQKMSRSYETTALRAAGFSLLQIIAPLLLLSGFLALCNFTLSAKITPFCAQKSLSILYQEAAPNPLLLLQRRKPIKLHNTHLQIQEEAGQIVDFLLVAHNHSSNRLEFVSAKELDIEQELLVGEKVAVVSRSVGQDAEPTLLIENQAHMTMPASFVSDFLLKRPPKITVHGLDFPRLLQQAQHGGRKGAAALTELFRRSSLSLSVFTFTLLGAAFGFEFSRAPGRRNTVYTLVLALLLLSSYFLGKGLRDHAILSAGSFLLPHCLVWIIATYRLYRMAHGERERRFFP